MLIPNTPQEDFAAIIKLAVASSITDAPRIDLLHLRFIEERPDEDALAEAVCHQVINYALPRRKLLAAMEKLAHGDNSIMSKLTSEARSAFISFRSSKDPGIAKGLESRYSEVGEVIAFCVACHFLGAGQVAAKMALKTNREMPVFGIDGIHAQQDDYGTLNVFFLESKMVDDALSGMTQYLDSAISFYNNRAQNVRELNICQDLSNLDTLPEPARSTAIDYFNPYSTSRANVRERFIGVITYDEPLFANKTPVKDSNPRDLHEKAFVTEYAKKHKVLLKGANTRLFNRNAEPGKFRAFYVAVPSISRLKTLFAGNMKK